MKLWVHLTDEAQQDILDALEWYAGESQDSAQRFRAHLEEAIEMLREFPLAFPVLGTPHPKYPKVRVRRMLIKAIPYRLLYFVERERIVVVGLNHVRGDFTL